jgi:hypothetical protein
MTRARNIWRQLRERCTDLANGCDVLALPHKSNLSGGRMFRDAASAEEDNYVGHLGRRDAQYANVQDHFASNPGGLAVVWAEENSRDSIFEAIRRRETYATSGTRPTLRFFAGELAADVCGFGDMIERAYAQGVPIGGELRGGAAPPRFLVSVQKDPGTPRSPVIQERALSSPIWYKSAITAGGSQNGSPAGQ